MDWPGRNERGEGFAPEGLNMRDDAGVENAVDVGDPPPARDKVETLV